MNRRNYYSILKDEPEVLTVLEVSKILRVGKNAAYELVKSGKLSSIQVGRKIIVPKAYLIDFLIDEKKLSNSSQIIPQKVWTFTQRCGMLGVADDYADQKKTIIGGKL